MPKTTETLTVPPTKQRTSQSIILMNTTTCSICREDDKPPSEMLQLTSCGHESCKECMAQWIQKEEESFRQTVEIDQTAITTSPTTSMPAPTCPFCRIYIAENDTLAILGRPFQPKALQERQQITREEEILVDELTLDWLREHSQACPTCGVHIEKVEGGCDKMECLCGCRFCFACGAPNAQCDCTPATHHFWDNHQDDFSDRNITPLQAPRDDETGLVDIRRHIQDRARRDRMTRVQRERSQQKDKVEWEAGRCWGDSDNIGLSTWNGTWLFCSSSPIGSINVLEEKTYGLQVMRKRYWRQKNALLEEEGRTQIDFLISSGHWIFNNKASTPLDTYQQLKILLLHQQHAPGARGLREFNRRHAHLSAHGDGNRDLSADWLFKTPTKWANHVLKQQIRQGGARLRRRRQAKEDEAHLLLASSSLSSICQHNIDHVVWSGRWLFAKRKTRQGTYEFLNRLVKHQLIAEERRMNRFELEEEEEVCCGKPDCSNCSSNNYGDNTENAKNIRLLFPDNETGKLTEREDVKTNEF